jgi:hypothetical protein
MMSHAIRAVSVAAVLAATAICSAPHAAAASFDGPWSVVVVTRSGACDASTRFGILIRGGTVHYMGSGAVSVSGRVAPSGQVSVSVSSSGQSANGSGRLADGRGSGTWRGRGSSGSCSGVWSASQGG